MPDIFYNETKQDEILLSVNENQTISHPTILGQKAHETQTDYSNPRQTLVRIVEGDNIQKAIDAVKESGGGVVYLRAGTYIVNEAIIGYSYVDIEGENMSSTIIDFNSTSANLSFAGTDIYTAGTITSITSGVNVTGLGTSWLTNVTTDHQIFIGNTWYKIAAVTGDTTLILAEGYQGNASLPGAAYRAVKIIKDVSISELTFKSSTGTGIVGTDVRNFRINNVQLASNNKGMVITNAYQFSPNRVEIISSTSNGLELTNARFHALKSLLTVSNGGHGAVFNNCATGSVLESASNSNTSDGYNITSCSDTIFQIQSSGNGGQGVECVSGNDNILIQDALINANTSDGIKLTATTDNCRIRASKITNNGGYGVNVAASTCDNNLIGLSIFSNNTAGDKNDSGTGTLWTANIPDSINTGGSPGGVGTFGGDGSDGALSITSGTTTIDLGSVSMVTKNYTSISITGTGKLAFSNPHANGTIIVLRSQGNVTITSSTTPCIDASGMGADTKTNPNLLLVSGNHYGGDGVQGSGSAPGGGGSAGSQFSTTFAGSLYTDNTNKLWRKIIYIISGTGSGEGGDSPPGQSSQGGVGAKGGGGLYIECKGAWNFTTTNGISVAGLAGSDATATGGACQSGGGGGGGGAGGMVLVLYGSLTANTGTINILGGAAGAGRVGEAGSGCSTSYGGGGGGGGGGSISAIGSGGSSGSYAISTKGGDGGNGGAGANGVSIVTAV